MEFQAVIESLDNIAENTVSIVHSDSRVLIDNIPLFTEWSNNNWLKKNNRPIPNVDLFMILDQLLQNRTVNWKWVKAHSGNIYNERCDELCLLARLNQVNV
jgi:ribonuclease HI